MRYQRVIDLLPVLVTSYAAGLISIGFVMLTPPAHGECRRVIERPDGVSIVVPGPADRKPGETEAEWCLRAFQHTITANPSLQGLPFHDVDSAVIPTDRAQRDKWRFKQGSVAVDPAVPDRPKSKEQQRKAACSKIEQDVNAILGLKELCATF